MSSGDAYEAYEIDYGFRSVASPQGWDCPEGKTLYHKVLSDDDDDGFFDKEVRTFCFDAALQPRRAGRRTEVRASRPIRTRPRPSAPISGWT